MNIKVPNFHGKISLSLTIEGDEKLTSANANFDIVNPDVDQEFPDPPNRQICAVVKTKIQGLNNDIRSYTASIEDATGSTIFPAYPMTEIPGAVIVFSAILELEKDAAGTIVSQLPEGKPTMNNRKITVKAYDSANQLVNSDSNEFKAWISSSSGSSSDSCSGSSSDTGSSSDSSSSDSSSSDSSTSGNSGIKRAKK